MSFFIENFGGELIKSELLVELELYQPNISIHSKLAINLRIIIINL